MKKVSTIVIISIVFLITSCGILNQAGEYERFVNSNFSLKNVQLLSVGGVDLENGQELSAGDIMTLTGRLFSGELIAKIKADVEVQNTSDKTAAISGLEWMLQLKESTYASGEIDKRVEVPPYGSRVFSVKTDIDMLEVINSESLPQIIKVVRDINNQEEVKKLGLELKIKPWFKSGTNIQKYPGWFSLKP